MSAFFYGQFPYVLDDDQTDIIGIRTVVKHMQDPRTHDQVGYFGKEPGIPVIVPAGSIAVFSSYVFHRSGPNLTNQLRRVYLPQYSPVVIRNPDSIRPWQLVLRLHSLRTVQEAAFRLRLRAVSPTRSVSCSSRTTRPPARRSCARRST